MRGLWRGAEFPAAAGPDFGILDGSVKDGSGGSLVESWFGAAGAVEALREAID